MHRTFVQMPNFPEENRENILKKVVAQFHNGTCTISKKAKVAREEPLQREPTQ